jgi:hypothetical protein
MTAAVRVARPLLAALLTWAAAGLDARAEGRFEVLTAESAGALEGKLRRLGGGHRLLASSHGPT